MAKINFEVMDHIKDENIVLHNWTYELYGGEEEDDFSLSTMYAITIDYLFRSGKIDEFMQDAIEYFEEGIEETIEDKEVDTSKTAKVIELLKKNSGITDND